MFAISHRLGNDHADPLRCLDEVVVGEMGVTGGGPVPPMAEQPADLGQVLPGHDRVTGHGVPQIMKPHPAKPGIRTDRVPTRPEAVCATAFASTSA